MAGNGDLENSFQGDILEDTEQEIKEPEMYLVVLHNDHFTTMDFVVEVIIQVFHKSAGEAAKIMLDVHRKGKGHVGIYPFDIAATKVSQVRQMAKKAEFPLRCTMEKA